MTHPSLMSWVDRQLEWARDAIRRHAESNNFELNQQDRNEIVRRVRLAAGIPNEEPCEHIPFLSEHLKGPIAEGERVILASLGPVRNLARLAPDQKLRFAVDGITLIYGDNGTGKGGYCRITKKLCRSLSTEELLGDIFANGARPPAEIELSFLRQGAEAPDTLTWVDGTDPPDAISTISVFDSNNARLYVDRENRIGFLPGEIGLLEQYASHCKLMDAQFENELKQISQRLKIPLPSGYSATGAAAELLLRLVMHRVLPSEEELRAAGVWSESDQAALEALEKLLAQDPQTIADRCRRGSAVLRAHSADAKAVEAALSQEGLERIIALATRARTAREAATLAASERFKTEPRAGVGLPPWRLMYDYAEKYIQSVDGEHACLPTEEGDVCALCQQPLSVDAAARMKRFAEFIADEASREAVAAQVALQSAAEELRGLSIPKRRDIETALAEYRKNGAVEEDLCSRVIEFFSSCEQRKSSILRYTISLDIEVVKALPNAISQSMDDAASALEGRAVEFELSAATGGAQRNTDRARLIELRDRRKLSQDLETILARRVDLEMATRLTRCRELVNTGQVSNKITTLRREVFSEGLEKRIRDEIAVFDLTHLPFRVADRSEAGRSMFGVFLDAPVGVANEKVLSEGEQRALALACFLGELGGTETMYGL